MAANLGAREFYSSFLVKMIYLIVKGHFISKYLEFLLLVIIVFRVICHLFSFSMSFVSCPSPSFRRSFCSAFSLFVHVLVAALPPGSRRIALSPFFRQSESCRHFVCQLTASFVVCLVHPGFWLPRLPRAGLSFSDTCVS